MVMLNEEQAHSEDDFRGRSGGVDAGFYHVSVNMAEEVASKKKGTPGVQIEFQVICDGIQADKKTATQGQSGKTINTFFAFVGQDDETSKRCIRNATRLALSIWPEMAGKSFEPDWSQAMGRELVIQVINERKETDEVGADGKKVWKDTGYTKVDWFAFWSLGNKAVAFVPKDLTSPGMQQLGRGGPNPPKPTETTGRAQASSGQQAAAGASATAAKTGRSKYADL